MERRSPAVCNVSDHKEGKDEMTKASIDLQDLRRRIYVKAKAETSGDYTCEGGGVRAPSATRLLSLFNHSDMPNPLSIPNVVPAHAFIRPIEGNHKP